MAVSQKPSYQRFAGVKTTRKNLKENQNKFWKKILKLILKKSEKLVFEKFPKPEKIQQLNSENIFGFVLDFSDFLDFWVLFWIFQ